MTQYSSCLVVRKQSDICHVSVHTEPDHRCFTCSIEIAFYSAKITDSLSGAYFMQCWQKCADNPINQHEHTVKQNKLAVICLGDKVRFLLEGEPSGQPENQSKSQHCHIQIAFIVVICSNKDM